MSIVLQGSTSGSVTLQEPAVAGTTVLDLPAVSGTILTTTSPKIGNVIQVVSASDSTYGQTSSTSFVDTTLSATITPTSSSSKILVLASLNGVGKSNFNGDASYRIIRGASTQVIYLMQGVGNNNTTSFNYNASLCCAYLDSPATTSSTTYKAQYLCSSASGLAVFNWYQSSQNTTSTITLLEIAA